jgi:DNA-binding PadR family transcriptional regulator
MDDTRETESARYSTVDGEERNLLAAPPAAETLTTTEAALLGLLNVRARSGYDLSKAVERGVGFFWAPARSGIYAVLPKLLSKGYVRRRETPGGRQKQIYCITEKGKEALRAWLEDGRIDYGPARNPFLVKLFFAAEARPEVVIELVQARKSDAERKLAALHAIEADVRAEQRHREGAGYFSYFTLRWGLAYYEALVAWAEETLAELRRRFPDAGRH